MKKGYDSLSLAIEDLQSEGYSINFDLVEDGVHSKDLKRKWKAGELTVEHFFRFEGMTNPGDNTILYAISCESGEKGLLVDAYGADVYISPEMIQRLKNELMELSWNDFEKVDMRVGTIITAGNFPEAKNPAYQLQIDFGPLGIKKTSAQITKRYDKKELIGKQVIAVVNFPKKQIATFMSECLILGIVGDDKDVILLQPDVHAKNGDRVG